MVSESSLLFIIIAIVLIFWAYVHFRFGDLPLSKNLYSLLFLLLFTVGLVVIYFVASFLIAHATSYSEAYIYTGIIGVLVLAVLKKHRILAAYFVGHILAILTINIINKYNLAYTGGLGDYYSVMSVPYLLIIFSIIIGVFLEYLKRLSQWRAD
ncbi:hypothetical protein [Natranaerobius thermophilus]|uniref:Uncharacterized protein n=1 Tax=Natranaerobius thermophilus (strain ATCC BAA-1301 / DSM 18059 / JW/NM-WN-LF) TaxID=457570 RepID=B2A130_NATTJ|nr:hypothetical protein [Natranaerobius thermophilus]ACB84653.1 hypothetical protein Nther_1069 [Natranaerobius thermophilus JW/NM-WN-LF]